MTGDVCFALGALYVFALAVLWLLLAGIGGVIAAVLLGVLMWWTSRQPTQNRVPYVPNHDLVEHDGEPDTAGEMTVTRR